MKRESITKVINAAKHYKLWVLASGKDHNFKYEFFNKKTGKVVLTYYPSSQHWLGTGESQGRADTYQDALVAAFGNTPVKNRHP